MPTEKRRSRERETKLRELQKTFDSVEDLENLSQPNLAIERDSRRPYVIETYTTYGTCDDPV